MRNAIRRIMLLVAAVVAVLVGGTLVAGSLEGQAGPAEYTWDREDLEPVPGEERRVLVARYQSRIVLSEIEVDVLRTPAGTPQVALVTPKNGWLEEVRVREEPLSGKLDLEIRGELTASASMQAGNPQQWRNAMPDDCTLARVEYGEWFTCNTVQSFEDARPSQSDHFHFEQESWARSADDDSRLLELWTEVEPAPHDAAMALTGFRPGSDGDLNCHSPEIDLGFVVVHVTALEECEHLDIERERDPRLTRLSWTGDVEAGERDVTIEEDVRTAEGAEAAWRGRSGVTFQCDPRGACALD